MSDLVPISRADLLTAISYGLRFRRGKSTRQHSELMAQLAAEALADLLDDAGYVVMQKAPALGEAQVRGRIERAAMEKRRQVSP